MIWYKQFTLKKINQFSQKSMAAQLGIEIVELGDNYLKAKMPVNELTNTPQGFLHGGASCVLAETAGSLASWLCLDDGTHRAAGIEINASHLRGVQTGAVTAVCRPFRLGRTLHVWDIQITDDEGRPVCAARLTVAIVPLVK